MGLCHGRPTYQPEKAAAIHEQAFDFRIFLIGEDSLGRYLAYDIGGEVVGIQTAHLCGNEHVVVSVAGYGEHRLVTNGLVQICISVEKRAVLVVHGEPLVV